MRFSPAKSRRDVRFDSLRGLLLILMAINHVPSDWHGLTDRSLGLFSAAEGFVFLSGLLAGIVYTRRLRSAGEAALHGMAVGRAKRIYTWHLAAFVATLIAVRLTTFFGDFCSLTSPLLFHYKPFLALLLGSTMLYQPGLLDILPMYCGLVLLIPLVLPALERGNRSWVIGLSFLGWLAVQGAPPVDGAPFYPVVLGAFNWFAWQFLFVLGLVVGHASAQPSRATAPSPTATPVRWPLVLPATALAIYAWGVHHYQWWQPWSDGVFGIMLNKPALGALRLGDFLIVCYLIAVLGSRFPRLLNWPPLALLGRNALVVMATQTVAVITMLQFPSFWASASARTISNLVLLAILFGSAWVGDRYAARQKAAAASAIPLGTASRRPLPAGRRTYDLPAA